MSKLYLLPTPLHEYDTFQLNEHDAAIISKIKIFIVENEKTARRFLKKYVPLNEILLRPLNQHTQPEVFYSYLNECKTGEYMALMSDCGCPGVCDPGSEIVAMAHSLNLQVIPMVGPSSLLLSLMASGLNGQKFECNGYIPIKDLERNKRIKEIENRSKIECSTQIIIEAPYRNQQLFDALLKTLKPTTRLCIATDVNTEKAFIKTYDMEKWAKNKPNISKRPTVFLLLA